MFWASPGGLTRSVPRYEPEVQVRRYPTKWLNGCPPKGYHSGEEVKRMRHLPSSPVLILENFADVFCTKHPEHAKAIDAFLQRYRLPDGSLQNDDNIMHA